MLMHKALDIPEILTFVFSFLRKGDLVQCALVGRTWHAVAHASLWMDISFARLAWGVPVDLFRKNAHLIAKLRLTSVQQFQAYGSQCTRLHELALPFAHYCGLSDNDLLDLIQRNRATLQSFEIRLIDLPPSTLVQAITSARYLRCLNLDINYSLESLPAFVYQVLKACPLLESFTLTGIGQHQHSNNVVDSTFGFEHSDKSDTADDSRRSSWLARSVVGKHPSRYRLRELSFSFPLYSGGFAFYLKLLPQCRDLVHLKLPPISPSLLHDLSQYLAGKAIPVESLDLSMAADYCDDDVAGLIEACPRNTLRRLDMSRRTIGSRSLQAILLCHCARLQQLHMLDIRCGGPSVVMEISVWIHAILSRCAQLISFRIRATTLDFVYLPADLILQEDNSSASGSTRQWACAHTLRELQVPIGGLCQPTSQWGWTPCKSQDHVGVCLNKHARVFAQLGSLTRLEVLDVTRNVQGPTLPDWLEWRMAYGLGHLSTLTQLEELVIPRHALLGQEEKEWMQAQWPNCNFLYR